jgi:hypothetical protein
LCERGETGPKTFAVFRTTSQKFVGALPIGANLVAFVYSILICT